MAPTGVSAAPNSSRIEGTVTAAERASGAPDRWNLELEVTAVTPIAGPTFVRAGERVRAFTFVPADAPAEEPAAGRRVTALAEYLGGPAGGWLQLTELEYL